MQGPWRTSPLAPDGSRQAVVRRPLTASTRRLTLGTVRQSRTSNVPAPESSKIGLALGSGGVRGFAHLGVLEVLEKAGIKPAVIVGSSAGAMIGAMYAFRPSAAPNLTHVRSYLTSELYDQEKLQYLRKSEEGRRTFYEKMKVKLAKGAVFATSFTRDSIFSLEVLRKNVEYLAPPVDIEQGFIRFAATAFDLKTGRELLLDKGPLTEALMASCAMPGVFPPVPFEDMLLMDGGVVNPVPCDHVASLGADIVIGVDVVPAVDPYDSMESSYDVAMRAAEITRHRLRDLRLATADLVIPVSLEDVFWGDFSRFEDCVQKGREAAERAVPKIRQLLDGGGRKPRAVRSTG